jgi:transposase
LAADNKYLIKKLKPLGDRKDYSCGFLFQNFSFLFGRYPAKKRGQAKGVDTLTVATILAETNGFELFKNQRQLINYAGYDVIENQSGNHVGKTRISKKGNSRIRRILHMPAFGVVTYKEPIFLNLYTRVYTKTKLKMKAYVAVQSKLLAIIYHLWKRDEEYEKGHDSKATSGNDESRDLFRFSAEEKSNILVKKVVLPKSSTTRDELQYNESPEVLFRLVQT